LLLRLAVELGRIGIFVTDLERKRTRFSPELCDILGLPIGTEMSYAAATALIDERDRDAVKASAEAAIRSSDAGKWSSVCRVIRADGATRWVAIHARRIYRSTTRGKRPVRSFGTVIDITHLRETEAAHHESELRLRLALDAARMGTFEADISGSVAQIDEQEARLLGLPPGTRHITAEEMRARIPLEDAAASDAKQERMTERQEPYHHEFRLSMPDGSERWLSAYADVRSNRIFGVNFDVTQRKLAEAALRDSETRLRIATGGAALGVFEWDPQSNRVIWENDRIYEIFGRTLSDGPLSMQQFMTEYLNPEDAGSFDTALSQAIRTGGSLQTICRIRRKDGARRWLQFDGTFEDAGMGKPARLIGVVADITARQRLAARAQRLSERLLTIQEEERRTIAQELHDSTVQHLVAASLALTVLRTKLQLRNDDDNPWNDLEQSLGEAMKELRTFSYLMHPQVLRGRGLCRALRRHVAGFSDRSGLAIELRADRRANKLANAVQQLVFRIVQEGLINVYRYASASQVSIELRHIGGLLHVIITDNGRGMGSEALRKRHPAGTGVGIRGIRMRLRQLGGRLRISPRATGGTRIHAVVPASDTVYPVVGG
jgi:PAS domain S-box-containing protein